MTTGCLEVIAALLERREKIKTWVFSASDDGIRWLRACATLRAWQTINDAIEEEVAEARRKTVVGWGTSYEDDDQRTYCAACAPYIATRPIYRGEEKEICSFCGKEL